MNMIENVVKNTTLPQELEYKEQIISKRDK
jgi:hypothetical protein